MNNRLRAFLRVFSTVLLVIGVLSLGIPLAQQYRSDLQESSRWSVSIAEVEELQEIATTTEAPEPTPPTEKTIPVENKPSPTQAVPTATTVTSTTVPLPTAEVFTNEVFGWIGMSSIGVENIPLLEGNLDDNQVAALDSGTAHWPGTALPGSGGNVVIGGHRTSHMRPFYYLDALEIGDEIEVGTTWGVYTYSVYRLDLDVPARAGDEEEALKRNHLVAQADRPNETITVYACNLPGQGGTDYRVIVHGDLIRVNGIDV